MQCSGTLECFHKDEVKAIDKNVAENDWGGEQHQTPATASVLFSNGLQLRNQAELLANKFAYGHMFQSTLPSEQMKGWIEKGTDERII